MQIRQIILDYREATGPCKARMLAQKLWAGEQYLLQIDSHMRFTTGWDEALLQWLAECEAQAEHGKAVLSTYPPSYEVSALMFKTSVPAILAGTQVLCVIGKVSLSKCSTTWCTCVLWSHISARLQPYGMTGQRARRQVRT